MKRLLRRPAVAVATASLLAGGLAAVPATAAPAATPPALFISEYIEGSSNNKAIEISNLTGAPVDLGAGDYDLKVYFNGSASVGLTIQLTGTVASGDVHVVAQSSANATILAAADQTNGAGWYNGDDAVVL
ncbi:MAG TPA: lamin tail domain-containing protein, partial [Agromyces sp.]|nr:lamin tail domain-containing protein [Agromyces sp.]